MMKRCKICGWWFEPKDWRQKTCDEECRKESNRRAWRDSKRRKKMQKKSATLKVDPHRLPTPPLPKTEECRRLGPPDPRVYERLIDNQWAPYRKGGTYVSV